MENRKEKTWFKVVEVEVMTGTLMTDYFKTKKEALKVKKEIKSTDYYKDGFYFVQAFKSTFKSNDLDVIEYENAWEVLK